MQFRFDIISILPWVFLYEWWQTDRIAPGQGMQSIFVISICLLRLSRSCRLSTAPRLFHMWRHRIHLAHAARTMVECGFGLVLLIHYLACMWSMVGLVNP